jgi:hypothetical protein
MRLVFASIVGWLLVCTVVASSQDKATPLPQEGYPGEWINVTKKGAFFTRFIVSHKEDAWWIEAWFNADDGKEAPFGGKVRLSLLGDNFGAKALPYGFATWDGKESTTHMTLRLDKGELVAEMFDIVKAKGGSNLRLQEKFKKK